ncbi:Thg1-domain-containing protein [Lojkania enalia]|uniref:tRNA(His) guanylyltransferase n=1 Tax=Lojkania enalia TaxID=147567 RepID=A0A9P4KHQ8_9PLEO|nr:Thg1-domain-containing protein [Didymosphaeria enalia]
MANSKYEYVRSFEQPDVLLANTWIVVRIDGRGFSKFTTKYKFTKPNDKRALDLMNAAAQAVMKELPDLVLAYGNSDEFSFVFHKDCSLFERRSSKLTTTIVSTFTSYYTFLWPIYFPDTPLTPPLPSFDGRAVCYPSDQNLRDYMSWRQVDCHINNLYNTTFWALVHKGRLDARTAEKELAGTVSSNKNEILFSRFGINYNNEPEIFKKGSVLYRDFGPSSVHSSPTPPRSSASPNLAHPKPRQIPRPMSQPLERSLPILHKDSSTSSAASTPRGPTFLSTSTTPSPPPSPSSMSIPAFPLPQAFIPGTTSSTASASAMVSKQPLPVLTPLPLPPPTLKPTTKPPPSLSPPNPIAHTNTSPIPSPIAPPSIPNRTTSHTSHSASASLSLSTVFQGTTRPVTASASTSKPLLKRRSPSLSLLEGSGPQIPLRISSIPLDNKPRKLSLPSQKSFGFLSEREKENARPLAPLSSNSDRKISPPLMTMKELPSPPVDDQSPTTDTLIWARDREDAGTHADFISTPNPNPILGSTSSKPQATRRSRSASQSRIAEMQGGSSSTSASASGPGKYPNPLSAHPWSGPSLQHQYSFSQPQAHGHTHPHAHSQSSTPISTSTSTPTPTPQSQPKSKSTLKSKAKAKANDEQSQTKSEEGRPKELSRTAKEKDRKKRQRARIVVEHVDIIKDAFWERRPWILRGSAG